MEKFISRLKYNIPWPLFIAGLILLFVGLLLKAAYMVFISGLFILGSVVVFVYGCVLDIELEKISRKYRSKRETNDEE